MLRNNTDASTYAIKLLSAVTLGGIMESKKCDPGPQERSSSFNQLMIVNRHIQTFIVYNER